MPHRRAGRRIRFHHLSPSLCAELLGHMKAPRWLIARAARAGSAAARGALTDPRRFVPRRSGGKGCAGQAPR